MVKNKKIIVVGSGPTAVSAAIPLVKKGVEVLMIEAGKTTIETYNTLNKPLSEIRNNGTFYLNQQTRLSFLDSYIKNLDDKSPKLRTLAPYAFNSDFLEINRIKLNKFEAVSGKAIGGLSGLWGASCSMFNKNELDDRIDIVQLYQSYLEVSKRMGISSEKNDALSNYLGDGIITDPPLSLSENANYLLKNFDMSESKDFKIGRPRLAIKTNSTHLNQNCIQCKSCFYGCERGSIYSATQDISFLKSFPNFSILTNTSVNQIGSEDNTPYVLTQSGQKIKADKLLLSAGVISTTSLVLKSLKMFNKPIRLLSNPAFTFALIIPKRFGSQYSNKTIGLSQLAFKIKHDNSDDHTFGMLYDGDSFPLFDFVCQSPFSTFGNRLIFSGLLSSLMVGLAYLPSWVSENYMKLSKDGSILLSNKKMLKQSYHKSKNKIIWEMIKLGAVVLPKSINLLTPGSEAHYAGTLNNAGLLEDDFSLKSIKNVYITDASNFKYLPEKPHTLTAMAIADMIGKKLCNDIS